MLGGDAGGVVLCVQDILEQGHHSINFITTHFASLAASGKMGRPTVILKALYSFGTGPFSLRS